MIAVIVSAIKRPILSILSGCLGESGLGNDSHFRNIFGIDTPKDSPSYRETSLPSIFSTSGEWLIMHGLDRGDILDI